MFILNKQSYQVLELNVFKKLRMNMFQFETYLINIFDINCNLIPNKMLRKVSQHYFLLFSGSNFSSKYLHFRENN